MGNELAKLHANVAHSAFERAVTLPAVLGRQEFEVVDGAYVQDRSPCALLLVFTGDAVCQRLEGNAVAFADFEMAGRHLVVAINDDGKPGTVRSALINHLPSRPQLLQRTSCCSVSSTGGTQPHGAR